MEPIVDPNFFALTVLYGWPLLTLFLFLRLPMSEAAAVSIISGVLVLPALLTVESSSLPGPGKDELPAIASFLMALIFLRAARRKAEDAKLLQVKSQQTGGADVIDIAEDDEKRRADEPEVEPLFNFGTRNEPYPVLKGWTPKKWTFVALALVLFFAPIGTVINNLEPIIIGPSYRLALAPSDVLRGMMRASYVIVVFLLARRFLGHPKAHLFILKVIFWGAIFYSPLVLWEIRFSPQLHLDIYGYLPQAWVQVLRGDGFRPLVFFQHGLELAMFYCMAFLAGIGVWRSTPERRRLRVILGVAWLGIILTLLNSLGAFALAIVFAPIALFAPRWWQVAAATVMAMLLMFYPVIRTSQIIPFDAIVERVAKIDTGRAESLNFRIVNEFLLLERALEKPYFGWGQNSRGRVYDEEGRNLTIPDGYWIVAFSQGGIFEYVAFYGLLVLPLLFLLFRGAGFGIPPSTACLALLLGLNLFDLLPNSSISALTYLFAGSIWGRLELGRIDLNAEEGEEVTDAKPKRSRFEDRIQKTRTRLPEKSSRVVRRKEGSRIVRRKKQARTSRPKTRS